MFRVGEGRRCKRDRRTLAHLLYILQIHGIDDLQATLERHLHTNSYIYFWCKQASKQAYIPIIKIFIKKAAYSSINACKYVRTCLYMFVKVTIIMTWYIIYVVCVCVCICFTCECAYILTWKSYLFVVVAVFVSTFFHTHTHTCSNSFAYFYLQTIWFFEIAVCLVNIALTSFICVPFWASELQLYMG